MYCRNFVAKLVKTVKSVPIIVEDREAKTVGLFVSERCETDP